MLSGTKLTFDEESQALYDAVAPTHPESYFQGMLDELERRLPGTGPLVDRVEAYRKQFVIPRDRLGRVFELAIAECRRADAAARGAAGRRELHGRVRDRTSRGAATTGTRATTAA